MRGAYNPFFITEFIQKSEETGGISSDSAHFIKKSKLSSNTRNPHLVTTTEKAKATWPK